MAALLSGDGSSKPYEAAFAKDRAVRVRSVEVLAEFRRTWRFHNKLHDEQILLAGRVARVVGVGYYHGGDVLYELEGLPGVWHECCLEDASGEASPDPA